MQLGIDPLRNQVPYAFRYGGYDARGRNPLSKKTHPPAQLSGSRTHLMIPTVMTILPSLWVP